MVADLEDFVLSADQVTRKLVNAVVASEVLDTYSPTDIKTAAKGNSVGNRTAERQDRDAFWTPGNEGPAPIPG